jgi:hypothetical protein
MKNSKSLPSIVVTASGSDTYAVKVEAQTVTNHRVTASPGYLNELGVGALPASRVIDEAFRFLMERESNTSILARFDLREIERYFPEFSAEIAQRLKS